MIRPQLLLDVNNELVVDGFAGGGGASTGIEMALGRHVDHAMNHNAEALGMHRINHSQTIHHCEDIFAINPGEITGHRRVGAGWFSPDCKHFSKAKGGRPLSKKIRGLAFVILRWAAIGTRVIYMENVEEMQTWGPLLANNKPDPRYRGRTFKSFIAALGKGVRPDHPDLDEMVEVLKDDENHNSITREQLIKGFGYQIEWRELRACDYGAPTIRKRLFLIARCDGKPIVWPKPTHAAPAVAKSLDLLPWRTVAECIDWSIPCNSIFLSAEEGKEVHCKRPLARATLSRIAKGVDRFVLKSGRPFLVSLTHQGGDDRVEGLDEPFRVITGAQRGEKAFVNAQLAPQANGSSVTLAGTIMEAGGRASQSRPRGLEESLHTITAKGDTCLATAVLAPFIEEEANQSNGRVMSANEPMRTICAQVKGGHFGLAAASMVKMRGDVETHGTAPDLNTPAHTVSAGGQQHGIVSAYLAQHNGGFNTTPGHPVDEPMSTISAKGSQQQVVAASVVAFYGTAKDGQHPGTPCRTVTSKERFALTTAESATAPLGMRQLEGARRVAKFLREFGMKFEGEFATVAGYVIWDLGMRMLAARELFRAQGFSDAYVIDRAWLIHPQTGEIKVVNLTKTEQIRMCGNSVCPPLAKALVAANSPDLSAWNKDDRKCPAHKTKTAVAA
jgi:DNA (cytosine-5)-methyltransferase 1